MAMRKAEGWQELLTMRDLDTVVESGTYRAVNTIKMSGIFKKVHSIELSDILHTEAIEKCRGINNIHLHHGNSAEVLPTLKLDYPVYYFLDAHWCSTKPAVTAKGAFPLWTELEYIAQRPYSDVIIVDDIHAFENGGREASDKRYNADWNGVNKESIIAAVEKYKPVLHSFDFHDCFVMHV
jgi:hypothetical protein